MKRFFLLLFALLLLIARPAIADEDSLREATYKNLEVFSNVLMLLQENYVDTIDPQEVISGAINGMLSSLDPHSAYMTPDDFKELQEETHGSFSGIGIEITIRDGILTVVSPIEDTPAYQAGLEAGDRIMAIEEQPTKNMSLMEAVKKLRGKKGTDVTISIFREEWPEIKDFTITRDEIPLISVKSSEFEPGLVYIRISNFQANTADELQNALQELEKKNPITGMILDLRNNPGGLLDQSVKVSDLFLNNGVIVSTKGRNDDQNVVFEAHPDGDDTFPMIVLVNGGSASASEIVAGALQDHKRGIILGTETFGKGSVQTIIPMPEGAGLRLTTAKYYTPSGDSIQATGIKPDILVEFIPFNGLDKEKDQGMRLREKDLPNHFENDNGEKNKDEETAADAEKSDILERLKKDNQLRTALYILKGLRLTADGREFISAENSETKKNN